MTREPTMEDVAERAGVSRALVSLVMRGSPKVSARAREAVESAARDLDYRPNLMARNLASRRTMTFGLMLNDLHNPFFSEVTDGVHRAADHHGYATIIATGRRDPDLERLAVDRLLDHRVDALLLFGPRLDLDHLEQAAARTPVVVVGRPSSSKHLDSVNNDEAEGARLAVDHLVSLGHTAIVHVDGGNGAGAEPRRAGFLRAMSHHGLTGLVVPGDFTEQSGLAAADAILDAKERPTAAFTANDVTAIGLMSALQQRGLRVPHDLSVVGYDNTALAALGSISLTTIDQPRLAMGLLAVETAIERLTAGRTRSRHHVLAPSLVVRSTTGPVGPATSGRGSRRSKKVSE
jgi:DNA-binding LacI/PurR family transcriptional regulator